MTDRVPDQASVSAEVAEALDSVRRLRAWLAFSLPPDLREDLVRQRAKAEQRVSDLLLGWWDLGGELVLELPSVAAPPAGDGAGEGNGDAADLDGSASDEGPAGFAGEVGTGGGLDVAVGAVGEAMAEGLRDVLAGIDDETSEVEPLVPTPAVATGAAAATPAVPASPKASAEDLLKLMKLGVGGHVVQAPTVSPTPPAELRRAAEIHGFPGALQLLSRIEDWPKLSSPLQVLLLETVAAQIRAAQEAGECFDAVRWMGELSAFSRTFLPGRAHGLARSHSPRRGSWAADALALRTRLLASLGVPDAAAPASPSDTPERSLPDIRRLAAELSAAEPETREAAEQALLSRVARAFEGGLKRDDSRLASTLKEHVGCFEGDQFKKLRKAIRKLEDADVEEEKASAADKLPPGWWETYGHVTEGKRGMLVGGDPRDPQWDRLKETFRFADLDWVGTEFKSKGLESARSRVLSGGVDLVLPLHRWCGHNADRILQPACKEHGVAFIPVQASYGITGIRLAIERFAEPEEG